MCQSKKQGGRRCFSHHPGTNGVVASLAAGSVISEVEIREDMRQLRKDAGALELKSPTPKQQARFLEIQQSITNSITSISDREKNKITRQLERAKVQPIDARSFYSWRNIGTLIASKSRSKLAAIGLSVGLSGVLAACAGGKSVDAPPTITNTNTPPSATVTVPATPNVDSFGLTTGATKVDRFGEYKEVKISGDASIIDYDQYENRYHAEVKDVYSKEELSVLHESAVRFLIEDGLNNPMLTDGREETFDAIVDTFEPKLEDISMLRYDNVGGLVQVDRVGRYELIEANYFPDGTRAKITAFELVEAYPSSDGANDVVIHFKFQTLQKETRDGIEHDLVQDTDKRLRFTKVGENWLINAWDAQGDWASTPSK